ncbi:MAG TPA: amidophosphoribosyltransferase [Candidatus Paceibacterota bacterium]
MKKLGEKCAVFGVYGKDLDVSRLTFFGLYALQHRGQESSGIATSDGSCIYCHKNTGLVAQVFNDDNIIKFLRGHIAIGHNRYSTSRDSSLDHTQPIVFHQDKVCKVTHDGVDCAVTDKNSIALAHNGNLPDTKVLEKFLKEKNVSTENSSDSEMIVKALEVCTKEDKKIEEAIKEVWPLMTGSFSILIMSQDKLIAIRDAYGIRPLSVARLNGGFVFASETCAFRTIGAEYMRDVLPGEMIVVDENGMRSTQIVPGKEQLDAFEFVYFSRPDSQLLGKSVYEVRKNFGKQLFLEYPIEADVIIPVPETAVPVAISYSRESGIPYETGLIKNRYIHRTFIEPEQHIRDQGVKVKLTPLREVIDGKRVVVMDDSIVRGTTSRQIVKALFEVGAKEVHFMISSPPVRYPDFYGIDTPKQEKLIAANKSIEEIREFLGATSLNYLSYEGMIKSIGVPRSNLCTSCFTGEYPIDIGKKKNEIKWLSKAPKSETKRPRVSNILKSV